VAFPFRRAKSSQDKSRQVKSSKSNSNLFYTVVGHSVFPCPVFRSSHPGSYKSPLPMSHLTSILCNGTGSKTPGGAGTPRDRHKNLTNQPQTITVPVKRHRGEPGHTRGTQDRGHTGTDGHTDHTDEPHNHPNPTTHPHDHATAETAAESTVPVRITDRAIEHADRAHAPRFNKTVCAIAGGSPHLENGPREYNEFRMLPNVR
jgi:hypothetical protein